MPDFALYFLVMSVLIFMAMFLLCWRRRSFSDQESDGNIDVHHLPPAFPSTIFPRTSGVHHKELMDALPVIVFMSEDDQPIAFGSECAVCLGTIEDKELLHLLPKGKHSFHMECIDKWLESHSSCPICRQNVGADDILQMVVRFK